MIPQRGCVGEAGHGSWFSCSMQHAILSAVLVTWPDNTEGSGLCPWDQVYGALQLMQPIMSG
jgi:hypothetical protein